MSLVGLTMPGNTLFQVPSTGSLLFHWYNVTAPV